MAILRHSVVFHRPGVFAAWPANNGLWKYSGSEVLVGFITGAFVEQAGHNIKKPYTRTFARTLDGGETWNIENPPTFPREETPPKPLPSPLQVEHPDLTLRLIGEGYHGSSDGQGSYATSFDKGNHWQGPFALPSPLPDPTFKNWEITCRTAYLPPYKGTRLLFLSARPKGKGMVDKSFVANFEDSGSKLRFLNWIVPLDDPHRAVMPSVVALSDSQIVVALRRRHKDRDECWIDLYGSSDFGKNWRFLSKVGETGTSNGNPPSLIRLKDGRLCCCYGDRTRRQMLGRLSADLGRTWGTEYVLRENVHIDKFGDSDFGYPQSFQRPDGRIVTIYYWASDEIPENHIAATTWEPDSKS